ncbi:hypothetical protein QTP88_006168 [Uroleucon formosanum]
MTDEKDIERTSRLLARARVKRTTIISQIRAIHAMALRVQSEPDLASEFALWFQFRTDDDSVLDLLAASDKLADYSPDLIAEVRQLINSAKNIAQRLIPKGADAVDLSYLRDGTLSVQKPREDPVMSLSRLPDIPLPTFDGDYRSWPNFRDIFSALVDTRSNLSNIDKMYYLIGCLKGAAAEAVRGIPVSADNYELVMNTLSNKFNRPRLVATSLVDKLLQSSAMTQESLNDLNTFVGTFSESISLLDALKIPDTGSFILFSIAFRRLPVSTRKLFEANSTVDYPSIGQLLDFLRSRVAILEVVGESHKGSTNNAPSKSADRDVRNEPPAKREAHPYQSMPVAMTVSIEGLMERFWQVEEPEAAPATFTDERRCEKLFCEQSIRLPCGRFSTIASDDCDNFECVRNALTRQTYVDDICDGADTISNILKLQSDLIYVLNKAGFELKKWSSNTPCVLEAVPAADRVCAPMPFESVDGYGTKVFGLQWHPEGDYLCCALSLDSAPVCTKRGILSLVARIFDPLGVFAPAVFLAKSIMQRTWQLGMTWDEVLPKNIHDEWIAFVSDLPSLLNIRVPRYLNSSHGAPCYLLGFCDASQLGYAVVVYVRMADVDVNASVFLIGTKTKLAPIKSLTIPRLELNAALLLARWLSRVRDILAPQLNIVGINAWSDSTIVLSWLGAPHEAFKIYVSNQVHLIRTLLPDCRWRHVDSVNNPADCASRGIMPATLAQHKLYWHGPQLAYGDPSEWDDARSPLPLCDLPELRPVSCATRVDEIEVEWFNRFSSYDRMLRVVAYMRRYSSSTSTTGPHRARIFAKVGTR